MIIPTSQMVNTQDTILFRGVHCLPYGLINIYIIDQVDVQDTLIDGNELVDNHYE